MYAYLAVLVTFLSCTLQTESLFLSSKGSAYSVHNPLKNSRNFQLHDTKKSLNEVMIEDAREVGEGFKTVAISGFVSQEKGFSDQQIILDIFKKGYATRLKAITDDLKFARKRLVSPKTVYSGLIDVLEYDVVELGKIETLEASIAGSDAWIAYGITPAELPVYAEIAAKSGLKRALFAVKCSEPSDTGVNVTFDSNVAVLREAKVNYTIIKYSDTRAMSEAKFPYRVMRAAAPIPVTVPNDPQSAVALSSGDLLRVIAESFDIEKTFNNVYSIGPGYSLDYEIMCYMKSRGWPERVQVGMLMGDFMERMERKYQDDMLVQRAEEARLAKLPESAREKPVDDGLAVEGVAQNNGFFS